MTATPRIYGEVPKKQEKEGEIVLYSMDDEEIFGKEFHCINFTKAVSLGSLVSYKVIVLTVDESMVGDKYDGKDLKSAAAGGFSVSNAAKVIGCWRALSKRDLKGEVSIGDDLSPMRRAVGFAQVINPSEKYDRVSSKQFADQFQRTIDCFKDKLRKKTKYLNKEFEEQNSLICDTRHIDGSMDATLKAERLDWLRADPEDNHCKVLFNVRCLSEGVDVPALDAVLFLSPRKSQVDVVQTVGRVMRISKDTNKKRGYVIIPIVTPAGLPPDAVLDNNKDFGTVWQVLKALKSIDEDFGTIVDGQLKTINSEKLAVICLTNNKFTRKGGGGDGKIRKGRSPKNGEKPEEYLVQQKLIFERDSSLEEAIKARIIKKVGNRKEWADWAGDVGQICKAQIKHIKKVLDDPENEKARKKFDDFSKELKNTLNGELSKEEILEMLGQHIVTKPVMDAIFSDFPFTEENPVARALTDMLNVLDKEGMKDATKLLGSFYESVKTRAKNIRTQKDRQTVILELFDKFFKLAFPKMRDKLGIVYTPVPIVDFINRSVADILKKEFHTNIANSNVHILDPFTGTGTFLTRLMGSGLIPKEKLEAKFATDIHAHEIVPLAYYVASMNIESTLHEELPNLPYEPNQVVVWTDTFADHNEKTLFTTSLKENNERLAKELDLDIRVIIGNPPYSVGQDRQSDNNENEHYEKLDARIQETYVANTQSSLKSPLYDSYIRAYRWASDRIKDKGIIGFVTNAGWIEANSADGMRKCMAEEFNSIYVFHLKGNQRTSGERSRQEGGKIFGEGSRAPVAIVILIKNPDDPQKGKIYFHEVDDYLTRDQKLKQVEKYGSVTKIPWRRIIPDKHGDWLNQRDDHYAKFLYLGNSKRNEANCFYSSVVGLCTARDAWTYNSGRDELSNSVRRLIAGYSKVLRLVTSGTDQKEAENSVKLPWTALLRRKLAQHKKIGFREQKLIKSIYRPFITQWLYNDKNEGVIERPGRWDDVFCSSPTKKKNLVICVTGVGAKEFSCLMVDRVADYQVLFNNQCFPRYLYRKAEASDESQLDLLTPKKPSTSSQGYIDAITDEGLKHFQEAYPSERITKDDLFYYIYGILHSKDYRTKYANNLSKELPRIPRVATYDQFMAFVEAGKKLADLHVNFEKQPRYSGVQINKRPGATYRVTQMRWGKIPGKTGNAAKDKTILHYNEDITIENIPLEAQEYVVNKKSALDWLVERCCVSKDKDSGIVNDFNLFGEEQGVSNYPYDLFLRMITVSLKTVEIVNSLPKLEIHPLDAD